MKQNIINHIVQRNNNTIYILKNHIYVFKNVWDNMLNHMIAMISTVLLIVYIMSKMISKYACNITDVIVNTNIRKIILQKNV